MPNNKGTTLYTLQKKFQNAFGFTLPLFHGRGLLNCTSQLLYASMIFAASAYLFAPRQIIWASCRTASALWQSVSADAYILPGPALQ